MHYVIGFWGRDNDMSGATIDQGYQRNEKLSELVLFYKKHTHTQEKTKTTTTTKTVHDITQIFKESMHSHDGVTSNQPASISNLLLFF